MTRYERGFLDCRELAADTCLDFGAMYCREAILSLTPEAHDSQPEGVVVPLLNDADDMKAHAIIRALYNDEVTTQLAVEAGAMLQHLLSVIAAKGG